nr:dihydroorotate dehydrogenase electron transfer subunit [Gordonibacter massiliensis (ex Traore et al. 2017)]
MRAAARSERTNVALVNERARILANAKVGPNLYLMTLDAPDIAAAIEPGQFVHMKVPGMEAHILRRPFSVYARDVRTGTLEILYQAVGFGSEHMTGLVPGQCGDAELIGPVGRAWHPADAKRALLVGGGVGAAPLFMLAESLAAAGARADVVLGAQTEQALTCRARYEELLDAPPRCATDDGSFGREGFCTSLVAEALAEASETGEQYDYLAVCGPEPLMKIVAGMAAEAGVPCEVSLEKRMACGIGACLSCVVDTVDGKKRACVDGPVFDARKVVW